MMKNCKKCGNAIDENSDFCNACTTDKEANNAALPPLEQKETPSSSEDKKSGLSAKDKNILIIIGLIAVGFFLLMVFSCSYKIYKIKRMFNNSSIPVGSILSDIRSGKSSPETLISEIYKHNVSEEEVQKIKELIMKEIEAVDAMAVEAKTKADSLHAYLPEDVKSMEFDSDLEAMTFLDSKIFEYENENLTDGQHADMEEKQQMQAVLALREYYVYKSTREYSEKIYKGLLDLDENIRGE